MKKNKKSKKWMSFLLSLMLTIAGAFGLSGLASGQAHAAEIANTALLAKNEIIQSACLVENNVLHGDKLYDTKYLKKITIDSVEFINEIKSAPNRSLRYVYRKGPFAYVNDA